MEGRKVKRATAALASRLAKWRVIACLDSVSARGPRYVDLIKAESAQIDEV